MKLIILLLLISCGVKVKVSDVEVTHKIDLGGIRDFCENTYQTNEEIEKCIEDLATSVGIQQGLP